ncbi:MAG: Mu transposase C-terminal domain-containing protein [Candidatus Thiodiazotropha sp. (ex Lucinoma borealis)]|nr:Mu transposase C-terminal domain-containing protein [Candidatus Thiodiazotropha sp. (ex Lucinoma borealis)]
MIPSLRDFNNWPDIPLSSVDPAYRSKFDRNKRIICAVLQGKRYARIALEYGLSKGRISKLLKKALGGDEKTPPLLTRALIPHKHHSVPKRRAPLSSISENKGSRCSFRYLLENVNGLKDKLDKIIQESIDDNPRASNITPEFFHSSFLLFLDEANHPKSLYPYTEKTQAYESLRQYLIRRRDELELLKIEKKNTVRQVISPMKRPFYYGREVQLDEHTYNAQSTIYLDFDDNLIPIRIARFSVVVLSDVDTTAALNFFVALTLSPSQFDILQTLESASIHREIADLQTPGIWLPPGHAFPNNISNESASVAFDSVAMDNALAHCAESVADYVCDSHFGTVRMGLPGQPLSRRVVESANRVLSKYARLHKSTTGTNVADPVRESKKNRKHPPIVTLFNLEEMIYAFLARHNNRSANHLGGSTPLEMVKQSIMQHPVRILPSSHRQAQSAFRRRVTAKVKWLRHEHRNPHIHFCHCRYQGDFLNNSNLIDKDVIIDYDYRDIRFLEVYSLNAEHLGRVHAPKSWLRYPHGIKTRQYIDAYTRMHRKFLKDPLVEFFWIQLNRPNSEKGALNAIRLYREYMSDQYQTGIPIVTQTPSKERKISSHSKLNTTDSQHIKPWSTEIAYGQ